MAPWCNHLGYADDDILVATNPGDVQRMYSDLKANCRPKGHRMKLEKVLLWSIVQGSPVRVGGRNLRVEAAMVFVGALICRDRTGLVGHRVGMASSEFCAAKFTTSALTPETCLQHLRAEILPMMTGVLPHDTCRLTSSAQPRRRWFA